jgi:hypothetical protein
MDNAELLDRCKAKLEIKSDYALAKMLDIPRMRISDYRLGKVKLDEYAYFKIAEILEESPIKLMAMILAKNAKNENKRLFFQRFFSIAALWISFGVIPVSCTGFSNNAYAAGSPADSDIKAHYAKLTPRTIKHILAIICRYFTCNWTRKATFGSL